MSTQNSTMLTQLTAPCRAALKQHSARQLRIMFALHHWHKPMTFSDGAARLATDLEAVLRNFFRSVRAVSRTRRGQHFPTIRWEVGNASGLCSIDSA